MKKQFINLQQVRKRTMLNVFLVLAICSGATFFGCQKKEKRIQKGKTASEHRYNPSTTKLASANVFTENTMAWKDVIRGYSSENTQYRHAKLFLSIGLAEVVKDPVIADWIINEAPMHEDSVFYFEDLFAVFPETKLIIESTVDPLEKYTGWSFEQVQDQMQYGDYNIKASIYVPTFRGQNNSLKPVVTPGDDISENADGNDIVLGWYINQNNEVTRVDMWTELSVAARAPVFAIDGRATNIRQLYDKLGPNTPMIPLGNDPGPVNPSSPPDDANERIAISKLQIGYRYDNNGHSEVEMVGKVVWTQTYNTPTGADPIRSFLRKGCYNNREEHVRIGDVSNYDADHWIVNNTDKFFCWMHDDAPTGTWIGGEYDHNYVGAAFQPRKVLFFNTYELDDSYTSNKALSPEWINGAHVDLKGRMGTYSEWYQFNPAAGQNVWWNEYAMRLHWSMTVWTPGSAWTKDLWTNPIKGMLQFKTTGFCTY